MKNIFVSLIIFLTLSINSLPIVAQCINSIELTKIISEFEIYARNNTGEVHWDNIEILFTMEFEGTTIPPADMIFLSNSIMILKWHSYPTVVVQTGNRFFRFFINNNQLKLISIDSRDDVPRWLDAELFHMNRNRGILYVDETEKSVIYDFSRNRILFGGVTFFLNGN